MDLESVADELYRASPDEFIERRKQRVAEARATRDRALVKALTQLRRPTRSAWLVNLVSQEAATEVADLLDLGTALGEAQRKGSGTDLRRLSKERQVALASLTRRACDLGAARGHAATEATRQEVSQTLQAAMADPSVAELVRSGRVIQAASYGGFGPVDLFGGGLSLVPSVPTDRAEGQQAEPGAGLAAPEEASEGVPKEDPARREAEQAVQAATEQLDAAREEADRTEGEAVQATAAADELADQVEALRNQLQQAEEQERQSREAARWARKAAQQSQQTVSGAEQALTDARLALDALS